MIKNNKIISLTIIGLVLGLICAVLAGSGQGNALIFVPFGGVVGFLAGWFWNTRSGEAAEK
ncbi:MAG: hypothetical protein OEM25_06515 [Gammaproteobacteria bacterium]|nr:hypothetical protein [Gammaproteobacteria bacterium]